MVFLVLDQRILPAILVSASGRDQHPSTESGLDKHLSTESGRGDGRASTESAESGRAVVRFGTEPISI